MSERIKSSLNPTFIEYVCYAAIAAAGIFLDTNAKVILGAEVINYALNSAYKYKTFEPVNPYFTCVTQVNNP